MKTDEEFRERKVLGRMEEDTLLWLKEGAGSFPDFEKANIEKERAEIDSLSAALTADIEKTYQTLEKCPQGLSALLYLTTDLTGDPDTGALLARYKLPVYLRYCAEVLKEEN